ncbi:MAG: T9SS type A sorting domain-containing protein [Chitinophagaceae bacterium]|nr:T9SS type A sorting domain-containing protein [Chitinophagaceae bacterium]
MKSAVLLILFTTVILINAKAQTVFAPPNSVWHYGFSNSDGEVGLFYHKYQTEKDTIFEGHLCSKVTGNSHTATGSVPLQTQYLYTANDTVFYFNFNFNKFLALYVFDVAKGDTLKFHVPFIFTSLPDTFRVVVDTVYNIAVDGILLRTVKTRSLDHFALYTYIERIGCYTFIGHQFAYFVGGSYYLSCYQDGDIDTIFTDKDCDYLKPTSIAGQALKPNLKISPNPFADKLQIDIDPNIKKYSIAIHDLTGRTVLAIQPTNGGKHLLQTSHLPNGFYYLQISSPNLQVPFYQKILKQ